MKDVCFRTDAAVVVVGSIGALPLAGKHCVQLAALTGSLLAHADAAVCLGGACAAAIVLILVPVGFYGAYYQNQYVLFGYIVAAVRAIVQPRLAVHVAPSHPHSCVMQALIGTVLLLGASFSWAESTDSAALYVVVDGVGTGCARWGV